MKLTSASYSLSSIKLEKKTYENQHLWRTRYDTFTVNESSEKYGNFGTPISEPIIAAKTRTFLKC